MTLAQQRCLNHFEREAVSRCPECRGYYCRECITEHEGRVICATCLRKLTVPASDENARSSPIFWLAAAIAGIILVWIIFYYVGQGLIMMPSEFHEG